MEIIFIQRLWWINITFCFCWWKGSFSSFTYLFLHCGSTGILTWSYVPTFEFISPRPQEIRELLEQGKTTSFFWSRLPSMQKTIKLWENIAFFIHDKWGRSRGWCRYVVIFSSPSTVMIWLWKRLKHADTYRWHMGWT